MYKTAAHFWETSEAPVPFKITVEYFFFFFFFFDETRWNETELNDKFSFDIRVSFQSTVSFIAIVRKWSHVGLW